MSEEEPKMEAGTGEEAPTTGADSPAAPPTEAPTDDKGNPPTSSSDLGGAQSDELPKIDPKTSGTPVE